MTIKLFFSRFTVETVIFRKELHRLLASRASFCRSAIYLALQKIIYNIYSPKRRQFSGNKFKLCNLYGSYSETRFGSFALSRTGRNFILVCYTPMSSFRNNQFNFCPTLSLTLSRTRDLIHAQMIQNVFRVRLS